MTPSSVVYESLFADNLRKLINTSLLITETTLSTNNTFNNLSSPPTPTHKYDCRMQKIKKPTVHLRIKK